MHLLQKLRIFSIVLPIVGLLGTFAEKASATKVIPLTLPEIVESAGTIVTGKVTAVTSGTEPETGLICTWTTVKIDSAMKGKVKTPEITFKQLGGSDKARNITDHTFLSNLTPGQEVLLCLYETSELGFSSPVGIEQGVFKVRYDPLTRKKIVSNGMPKHILFSDRPFPATAKAKDAIQPFDSKTKDAVDTCKSLNYDDVKKGIAALIGIQEAKAKGRK